MRIQKKIMLDITQKAHIFWALYPEIPKFRNICEISLFLIFGVSLLKQELLIRWFPRFRDFFRRNSVETKNHSNNSFIHTNSFSFRQNFGKNSEKKSEKEGIIYSNNSYTNSRDNSFVSAKFRRKKTRKQGRIILRGGTVDVDENKRIFC